METCYNCKYWVAPQPDKPEVGNCRNLDSSEFQLIKWFNDSCDDYEKDDRPKDGA